MTEYGYFQNRGFKYSRFFPDCTMLHAIYFPMLIFQYLTCLRVIVSSDDKKPVYV